MLDWLYTLVSWILLGWHKVFTFMRLDEDSGLNWTLSIVMLVVTIRLAMFRFFVKQVKHMRRMAEMQPKIQALREKYKKDRQEMQRQMMKLQQDEKFNPVAGCLPMFLQIPVFISLFHVLTHLANQSGKAPAITGQPVNINDRYLSLYGFTPHETISAARADLFGAPLAAKLTSSVERIVTLGGEASVTRSVTIVLVIVSALATYLTQRAVMNNAVTPPIGTAATVQKVMLYFIPLSVLASGVFFPLGVLLYWFTSNLWTLGQQLYIHRFHPHEVPTPAPVGEKGKTLAPKPGAKPNLTKGRRPVGPSSGSSAVEDSVDTDSSEDVAAPARPSAPPRPGAKPQRPGGNRPSGKRPNQAKKRR